MAFDEVGGDWEKQRHEHEQKRFEKSNERAEIWLGWHVVNVCVWMDFIMELRIKAHAFSHYIKVDA